MIKITVEQAAAIKRIDSDINVLLNIVSKTHTHMRYAQAIADTINAIVAVKFDKNIEIIF
jgi:hypothetical protein